MIWSFSILEMVSHEYAMLNFIILKQANKQTKPQQQQKPKQPTTTTKQQQNKTNIETGWNI